MTDNKAYWDQRFQDEGYVWGTAPSPTAEYAAAIFRKNGVQKILVPGSGYGRNTKFFSESGFDVTGIEISDVAGEMAREYDPQTRTYHGSVLNMSFDDNQSMLYTATTLCIFSAKKRGLYV